VAGLFPAQMQAAPPIPCSGGAAFNGSRRKMRGKRIMSKEVQANRRRIPDVKFISGNFIDMAQIAARENRDDGVVIWFRNGEKIEFSWRDEAERRYLIKELSVNMELLNAEDRKEES